MAMAAMHSMRGYSGASQRSLDVEEGIEPSSSSGRSLPGSQPDLAGWSGNSMRTRNNSFSSQLPLAVGLSGRAPLHFPCASADYTLLAELGLGVTATVYLALCRPLRRKVAVKLLDLEAIERAGGLDVVIKETAVMAGMRHPNVLALLAAFVEGGSLWMVLPFYAAGSLLSIVQYRHPEGMSNWHAVATVMREVARGLAYMHGSGRIHRDLKAANILVAPDGRVALADFGVSAALEATPGHDGASQSQHQPGATHAFDAAAHMRRVSVQQQANSRDPLVAERASAEMQRMGGASPGGNSKSKRMSAAEYRAARQSGKIGPSAPPPLLTQSLGGKGTSGAGNGGDGNQSSHGNSSGRFRSQFSNAAAAAQYLGRSTFVGTPCWMAPEVMAPQVEGYGQAADIWSFGITLLEVATGKAPTARRSVEEILISVLSSPEDDPSSIAGELSHTPEAFQEVVYTCLAKNPAERPTAAQLLQMRFFKTMAMDPATLAVTLLEGVPPVTHRDDGNPPPAAASLPPERSARSLTVSRSTLSSARFSGGGGGGGDAAADALETAIGLLRQLGRGQLGVRLQRHALSAEELQAGKGFGFAVIKRGKYLRAASRGRGFVVAQLPPAGNDGVPCWSAPSWFQSRISASGFTTGNDEVACLFVVKTESEMEAYMAEALAPIRAADSKTRTLSCCRSLTTASLTELSLSKGGSICADQEANEAMHGQGAEPSAILGGRVRPPPAFTVLYEELAAVLNGEPLESPGTLDTPADARHVSAGLSERISAARFAPPVANAGGASTSGSGRRRAASFSGHPGVTLAAEGDVLPSGPSLEQFMLGMGIAPRRPSSGSLDSPLKRSKSAKAAVGAGLRERAVDNEHQLSKTVPGRAPATWSRADTLQDDDLLEALQLVHGGAPDAPDGAAADLEGSGSGGGGQRPMLVRLSTSSSAPDLQKLSIEGSDAGNAASAGDNAGPLAPDMQRVSAGAATTDDIEEHGSSLLPPPPPVRIARQSPRLGPGDDTAMDPAMSPGARSMVAKASQPQRDPQPASPVTPPNAGATAASGSGDGGSHAAAAMADERHPHQALSPNPSSPGGSASGGRGHRTPSGLEPVLEDKTLIASMPANRSVTSSDSVTSPDASIFDIGALAMHSDQDHAAQAAMLDGDDSDSPAVTPLGTNTSGAGGIAPVGNHAAVVGGGAAAGRPSLAAIKPSLRAAAAVQQQAGGGAVAAADGETLNSGSRGAGGPGHHWAGYHGELPTPRTPGGHEGLRRLAPNPTSSSAQPRQHTGQTPPPKGSQSPGEASEDPYEWTFERDPEWRGSVGGRRRRSSVSLPPRESLTQADLSELMEDIEEAEEAEPAADAAEAAGGQGLALSGPQGRGPNKGGKEKLGSKIGNFLYNNTTWGYMPTC